MPEDSCKDFYYKALIVFNDLMKCLQSAVTSAISLNVSYEKGTLYRISISKFKVGLIEPYRQYVDKFYIISLEEASAECLE